MGRARLSDDSAPLRGLRVVVTRARHQADSTVLAFESAGAHVERLPLIEVVPPADPGPLATALAQLEAFDWVLFTSSNTVNAVLEGLDRINRSWPSETESARVAAVGTATAEALRARGIEPDLQAFVPRAEGLADLLGPCLVGGERLLLPQAADARPVLEELLLASGGQVVRVDAYAKQMPPSSRTRATEIFGDGPIGWVTFTSPSIARNFASLWGDAWPARRDALLAVSIGRVTSTALRRLGVEPAAEAATPGDEGLVAAVVAAVAGRDAPAS